MCCLGWPKCSGGLLMSFVEVEAVDDQRHSMAENYGVPVWVFRLPHGLICMFGFQVLSHNTKLKGDGLAPLMPTGEVSLLEGL